MPELETKKSNPDYWTPEGLFVHNGIKYGVARGPRDEKLDEELKTICVGAVAETTTDNAETLPDKPEVVTKPSDNGIPLDENHSATNEGEVLLQKNKGGRPRKEGKVTRMTEYRRKKEIEKQGVLL